jgi:hypothetical protein
MRTTRSKKLLLLPLIPALAFGAVEVVSKINVAAAIISPDRGVERCACVMPVIPRTSAALQRTPAVR